MTARPSRSVLAFACAGHALFHILVALFMTLVLVLAPLWRRSYDDLIGLWTWGALLLGLGAPVAGWCSDRWGETRVMIAFFLGIGAATMLCGLADEPVLLGVALTLIGLFGAIYHPVGTAWVVKNVERRGRSIAILGICGSIGGAVASLVAGVLADLAGWRAAFIVPGAVTIAIGAALAWAYAAGAVVDRDGDVVPTPEPHRGDLRRAFAALAVTMSLTTLAYYAFTIMLPKWIEREMGWALGEGVLGIGALVTAIYLLGATAQFVGGHYADRGFAKQVYVASFALKLFALVFASFIGGWPVVVAAAAIVFVFDIAAPVENVLIARYTSSRRRGLAFGVRNGIAIVAAPLGIQLVALLFDEATGFATLFLVLAAIVLAILMAALLLPADRDPLRSAGQTAAIK
jgi:MFS transporter, FSR family, fosmidomycin resistance protein